MSVEPQALERSVLEAKERDELSTIAEALGRKPSSRASKAGLVDAILQGIGVEEPKPKKTRARKKPESAPEEQAAPGTEAAQAAANGETGAPAAAVEASTTVEGTGTDVPD